MKSVKPCESCMRKSVIIGKLLMELERECTKNNPREFWRIDHKSKKFQKLVRAAHDEAMVGDIKL